MSIGKVNQKYKVGEIGKGFRHNQLIWGKPWTSNFLSSSKFSKILIQIFIVSPTAIMFATAFPKYYFQRKFCHESFSDSYKNTT